MYLQHDIDYVVLGEEDKHTNEKDEGETVLSAGGFIPDGCWMRGKETGKRHGAFYDLPVPETLWRSAFSLKTTGKYPVPILPAGRSGIS